ncbi:phage tail tape measure protein [Latilactobacillus curvatus]|uniref:phage tail tape measure protein n=1 Tax=Latilactobacillus curvatus TaxID=28038 RepID=UPI000B613F6C|nr:phage tail tape measure protein [Latilactobacillus curvatus]ASN62100.1 phage tail tape measure protein [Latilactobacillus curvatus]MCT2879513.1 phage tail tape measure protein [Latilactobacillus curvatus]
MAGSLGHISGTVSLDINPFKQSTRVLQQQIKATGNAVRAQETAIKSSGKSINDLKTNYATMGKQLKQYNALLAQQKGQFESYRSSIKDVNGATDEQKNKLSRLENEYNKTAASTSRLEAKMQATARAIAIQESGWTKAGEKLTKFGNATTTAGEKLTSLGRKATIGITTPIVGGFTAAAKSAIDFNSQISAIGPLLTNGGKITASVRSELDQMSSSSKKWAMQFGISTNKINDGMTEMVKRGYTAQQTMGAMPAVLNAAKASGDDFNDVMHVSTSVLEQFGLKTESTTGMLKNTSRVTDSLTYVANATAAGFQDMGEAMTYVGPSAHAAGISLEETAAAIGIMSNKGIEGSVAGTALRGALTRLMKPSKQNVAGFKAMGVSVEDFKKGTLTLPEIIDKIKNNTAGWTDQQRASSIAMAFGTEAQAGMNALISSGGDELRKYTKGAKDSAGTTKKIADQLNDTQAAKVARFKESIHVLGIEFGEKLLPTLTPLIEKATDMVQAFSNMDSATQQSIIKWALFAAAIGPVSGVLGNVLKVTGSVSSGLGGLFKMLGRVSGTSKVAESGIEGAGTALTSAGKGAGSFSSGLSLLNPYVLGTIAVVGAGVAVWELWGKKAVESADRTSRWGTDVSDSADKSLTKMQGFSTQASAALEGFNGKTKTTTKQVASNFSDMYEQMVTDSKNSIKKMEDDINDLPGFAKKDAQANVLQRKKANAKILADARKQNELIQAVLKKHNGDVSKLTDDERTIVLNGRTRMNADEVKLLQISGKAKKSVIAALNGDIDTMNHQQRGKAIDDLTSQFRSEEKTYQKQAAKIKKAYSDNTISAKQYGAYMKQLKAEHNASTESMVASVFKLAKANGESKDQITQDLLNFGYTYEQAAKIVKTQSQDMSKSTGIVAADTANMSKKTAKANEQWNKLIFDPKTGKVKTNAQEEVNKAAQSQKGWNQLTYDLKHANLSSNAKLMIGEVALANGKWDDLTWKEQQAIVAVKGNKKMADIIQQFGIWDQFTLEQKEAILHGDASPIANLLLKGGQWNMLTLKEQQALVKDKATVPLVNILDKYGVWQGLSDSEKNAILNAKGAPALADMVIKYGAWNNLPQKQKDLLINNTDARQKLIDSGILLDTYKTNNPASKPLKAHDGGLAGAVEAGNDQINSIKRNNPPSKPLKGHDAGLGGSVLRGNNQLDGFKGNTPSSKGLKAHDAGLGGAVTTANDNVNNFKRNNPKIKNLKANDNASGPADDAASAVDRFSWKRDHKVTLTTVFETVEKKIKSFFANGTNNAPGGPAVVNDQNGANFQELVIPKGGNPLLFSGRNVFLPNLKKGSTVVPANKTKRILSSIPHFKNGTANNTRALGTLLKASAINQDTNVVINNNSQAADLKNVEVKLDKMIMLLSGKLTVDVDSDNRLIVKKR